MMAAGLACGGILRAAVHESAAYGVKGDGVVDDGPAISRMVAAAKSDRGGPVVLSFERGKTYRIASTADGWLFDLDGMENLTLDGGGSVFLLAPEPRFLSLVRSKHVVIRGFKVDYDPLPFVEGRVTSSDPAKRRIDIRLNEGASAPLGGAARQGGEQAFFAMLWNDGAYTSLHTHCWVEMMAAGMGKGTSVLTPAAGFMGFPQIIAGKTRISLPVPGIAHRRGPGGTFRVSWNSDVSFEDVELWSAPWFGFEVNRNPGAIRFLRTHIRPKPGSGRWMSTWRDGFHVKGNRGSLRWDDCIVTGTCDDAFNIATHSSVVSKVISPTRIEVRQKFPLMHVPWEQGGTLVVAREGDARLVGRATIRKVETGPVTERDDGEPAAPRSILTLAEPVEGIKEGLMAWDPASSNPDTILKNCTIEMSCRFQSPVALDGCTTRALMWFYSEDIEGVFPVGASVRNCTLYRGRGNASAALIVRGAPHGKAIPEEAWSTPRAVRDIVIENNRIHGAVIIEGVENLRVKNNRMMEAGALFQLRRNHVAEVSGNVGSDGKALPGL
jgi:hypothetical protein